MTFSSKVLASVGERIKVSTDVVRFLDLGNGGGIAVLVPLSGLFRAEVSSHRDCEPYHGNGGFSKVTHEIRYLLEYHGHGAWEEVALFLQLSLA